MSQWSFHIDLDNLLYNKYQEITNPQSSSFFSAPLKGVFKKVVPFRKPNTSKRRASAVGQALNFIDHHFHQAIVSRQEIDIGDLWSVAVRCFRAFLEAKTALEWSFSKMSGILHACLL